MTDNLKLIARERREKAVLLAGALIVALIAAARMLLRGGKLMLFRYNLGVSIEDAGILYDYQTVMIVLVGIFVLIATFLIYIYIYTASKSLNGRIFSPCSPFCSACCISLR